MEGPVRWNVDQALGSKQHESFREMRYLLNLLPSLGLPLSKFHPRGHWPQFPPQAETGTKASVGQEEGDREGEKANTRSSDCKRQKVAAFTFYSPLVRESSTGINSLRLKCVSEERSLWLSHTEHQPRPGQGSQGGHHPAAAPQACEASLELVSWAKRWANKI